MFFEQKKHVRYVTIFQTNSYFKDGVCSILITNDLASRENRYLEQL